MRTIRENRDEEADYNFRRAVVRAEEEALGERKVLRPYYPRDLGAGDPMSESGVKVAEGELDDALKAKVNAAGQLLEVALTFPDEVPAGTAINIQDGTYSTGGPAVVEGDGKPVGGPIRSDIIALPGSGMEFKEDARISVSLNGQDLERGDGTGNGDAEWVSTTQLKVNKIIHTGNQVVVRAPMAPPSPPAV